ncbi:MAG: hypothetical protein A2W99_16110 [Bacteroidetes bacterium GWF2_33_16]|nr:MAG: hypothetical protein A2X00_15455 [Bacteroidetes bacterium GWE2_32_14]OFY02426.1 MAG: hypothetical protein A2W99_16110 [Bacteroidetes bacterium GWF2_33_16]
MSIVKKLKIFISERKEKLFWNNPDKWLAVIILDENLEQVYGKVRNNLAILERIPKPETGYSYLDIVTVEGPIGKQLFRDEEIDVYKAIGIYRRSNILTFTYNAIIPNSKDYFRLLDWFKAYDKKAEFPWSPNDKNMEWRKGYCTADNLEQANRILREFISLDKSRQVKDIEICMNYEE